MLKSDQDGIEIQCRFYHPAGGSELKSDQDGIEIKIIDSVFSSLQHVEIRPRWD